MGDAILKTAETIHNEKDIKRYMNIRHSYSERDPSMTYERYQEKVLHQSTKSFPI